MTGPDPDRIRYAQIAGTAARHALGWRLTGEEEAAAVAELAGAAAGRADLLAQCAGLALGFGEGSQDAARYRQMAELCILAGADETLIERWVTTGRQRAAAARAMPHSGRRARELAAGQLGCMRRTGAGRTGARVKASFLGFPQAGIQRRPRGWL